MSPEMDWADAIALELPEAVYKDVRRRIDAERAARESAEAQVSALRAALWELDGGDNVTVVGDLKELLRDTAATATAHDLRIRRETDEEWKEAMHALAEAAGSWEVNGFALAVIVRIEGRRALAGTDPPPKREAAE